MSRQASGLKAWIIQRVTAVYLALFIFYLITLYLIDPPVGYQGLRRWLANDWVSLSTAVFFVALLLHSWIGVRDILIDYIKPLGLRVALLSLVALVLLASGLWAMQILMMVQLVQIN